MCGICASTHDPDGTAVAAMSALLRHRGPNDDGIEVDREAGVAIGARRLNIIDLDTGHQPIANEDGTVHVVFNGEIYNYAALREQLAARGHVLRTRTDTEVLVHLYEDYGEDLVHALEGMYTFLLWDSRRRRLIAARDRFGEKPLFYREHSGRFQAASELTALLASDSAEPRLDPAAVDSFFVFGYVPGGTSIAEGVRQLRPGHLLTWAPDDGGARVRAYWRPPRFDSQRRDSLGDLADEVGDLLESSVRRRLVADVPLGVFLSGGVDSTLVAALAARHSTQPIKTFTVGYTVGELNETAVAREVARALGAEHHELILTEEDVAEGVPSLLGALDQPLADQALVALHAVAEFARSSVTVAVGGEGADELFAGYPRYRWLSMASRLGVDIPQAFAPLARRVAQPSGPASRVRRLATAMAGESTFLRHVDWVTSGRRHLRARLYGPELRRIGAERLQPPEPAGIEIDGDTPLAGRLMRLDQEHWLPDDVLAKADRASMLASLELRTPYLSRELAEFAAAIPVDVHLQDGGKAVLRRTLRNVERGDDFKRVKTAFRVPVADWLRGPLEPLLRSQLRSSAVYSQGWFDRGAVARLAERHLTSAEDRSEALWPLVVLGCWLDGGAPPDQS